MTFRRPKSHCAVHHLYFTFHFQGAVEVHFNDDTVLKTNVKNGYTVSAKRYISSEGILLNITQITGKEEKQIFQKISNGYYLLGCQTQSNNLKRCIVVQGNLKSIQSCTVVNNDFLVECFEIPDLQHITLKGCHIEIDDSKEPEMPKSLEKLHTIKVSTNQIISQADMTHGITCPLNLKEWIEIYNNENMLWYEYNTSHEPFDIHNPEIEIEIPWLKNRVGIKSKSIIIQDQTGFQLFQGTLKNGKVKGKVDEDLKYHPSWRSRLLIGIDHLPTDFIKKSEREKNFEHEFDVYLRGSLKNGKLNGLIQAFGIFTVDPYGHHCSKYASTGLSFVGWFKDGKPSGPCWRFLIGGSVLYGKVDENGDFTGLKDVAFIYQDLELALIGSFRKGIMVSTSGLH